LSTIPADAVVNRSLRQSTTHAPESKHPEPQTSLSIWWSVEKQHGNLQLVFLQISCIVDDLCGRLVSTIFPGRSNAVSFHRTARKGGAGRQVIIVKRQSYLETPREQIQLVLVRGPE
jgi:hypothetical protein